MHMEIYSDLIPWYMMNVQPYSNYGFLLQHFGLDDSV